MILDILNAITIYINIDWENEAKGEVIDFHVGADYTLKIKKYNFKHVVNKKQKNRSYKKKADIYGIIWKLLYFNVILDLKDEIFISQQINGLNTNSSLIQ